MCTRDLPQHLFIAGGPGFVGASLAIAIRTTHQREDVLALDLSALILEQLAQPDDWNGATVNVGGGVERSLSPAGAVFERTSWRSAHRPRDILGDTFEWIRDNAGRREGGAAMSR